MIVEHNRAPHWYDDQHAAERLAELESRSGTEQLTDYDRDELDALSTALRRRTALRAAADNPHAHERVDNSAAGLGTVKVGTMTAGSRETGPWTDDLDRLDGRQLRDRALGAIDALHRLPHDAGEASHAMIERDDDPQSRTAKYVIAASDPAYYRAFTRLFNDPLNGQYEWDGAERDAFRRVQSVSRSLALGASGGGFLVPYELDPNVLLAGTGSVDPMRAVARVEKTAQNEKRFVTSLGSTASWDAELAEVSSDEPTLLQPTITAYKGNCFIPVSFELAEDSDISRQVGNLFADAKAQLESVAFTTGAGGSLPKGVITATAAVGGSVILDAAGTALTVANVTTAMASLPPRWRANASWMMNLTFMNQARLLPKYANGPAMLDDSTNPPTMMGWKVYQNSNVDGTIAAGATADYCLLVGDFKQYIIVDRLGATLQIYPGLVGANRRPTGEIGYQLHWRAGGDLVIADAMRLTNWSG